VLLHNNWFWLRSLDDSIPRLILKNKKKRKPEVDGIKTAVTGNQG
jgi:hypothetical protein